MTSGAGVVDSQQMKARINQFFERTTQLRDTLNMPRNVTVAGDVLRYDRNFTDTEDVEFFVDGRNVDKDDIWKVFNLDPAELVKNAIQ